MPSNSKQIKQFYPEPGWVNEDPDEILSAAFDVISACLKVIDSSRIIAIGICNQRESTMVWDRKTKKKRCQSLLYVGPQDIRQM